MSQPHLVPAKIVRLMTKDRRYVLHPSMFGHEFLTCPETFTQVIRRYQHRPAMIRKLFGDAEASDRRVMFGNYDPETYEMLGAYPAELIELLP